MALDTSIYGMLQQAKPLPGPLDRFMQAQQIGSMLDQQQLGGLQRQLLEQQVADAPRARAAAEESAALERRKKLADIGKVEGETAAGAAKMARDSLAGVTDQMSYDAWRADGSSRGWQVARNAPAQFDPAWRNQQILTADEFLKQQDAQRGRDVTTRGQDITAAGQRLIDDRSKQSAAETARHNREMERIAGEKASQEKRPTDVENVSAGYASRMRNAAQVLSDFERQGVGKPEMGEFAAGFIPFIGAEGRKAITTAAQSEPRQQYRQAQEDWVRAKLRKESGAVIADEEMDREIRTYFPQLGDKPKTVEQKAKSRQAAEAAMVQAAGRAPLQSNPAEEVRRTVGGKNYVKINGKWFEAGN